MSLKMKLTSTICAFILILGLVITGVFAVPQATVNLGGTLTFSAKDVYARVTGTISGSVSDPTLEPIEFNAGSASDTSTWTNNLAFKDDGSTITITINVENLATDRPLYVSITDTLGNVANINKSLTNGAFELAAGANATATITLDIADKNASLSGASYGYSVELLDESAVQSYDAVSGLAFECDTNAKTASVRKNGNISGDLTIPAFVKNGEVICAVTSVGATAFTSCTALNAVFLPSTITSIGDDAFGDSSLTCMIIPEGVTSIGARAFMSCSYLTYLTLPNSLVSVGASALATGALVSGSELIINYNGTEEEWNAITGITSSGVTATVNYLG